MHQAGTSIRRNNVELPSTQQPLLQPAQDSHHIHRASLPLICWGPYAQSILAEMLSPRLHHGSIERPQTLFVQLGQALGHLRRQPSFERCVRCRDIHRVGVAGV